jgi:hypothetical protein
MPLVSLVEQKLLTLPEHLSPHPIFRGFHEEEFEDTKGAIRIRISKKNRKHNGQMKKYKRTNNDQQNIHIQLKIE